jgi:hypothetical protein
VIERSVVPIVRVSTASDPLPSSVAGALTSPATTNGVAPSGGPASRPRSTCNLGVWGTPNGGSGVPGSDCSGTLGRDDSMGRYCGGGVAAIGPLLWGDGATDVQEPGVDEPSVEVLCVEEPSGFRQGHARSSGELKPRLHW